MLYDTFRFVDSALLPENETHDSSFLFSKDLTSGHENSVWGMKLMCLTRQTILFGSRNNIVPGTFCLFFENEMFSFLK